MLSLAFTILSGIPLYLYFRKKMSQRKIKYIKVEKRVVKLTLINIILTLIITVQLLGIFINVLLRKNSYDMPTIILSIFFITTGYLIFYGAGMYITSIVIEDYVKSAFEKNKSLFIPLQVIKLFHGPLSHILLYCGCLFALLELSLLDYIRPAMLDSSAIPIPIILGLLGGIFWTACAIASKTYRYQLVVVIFCIVLLGSLSIWQGINIILFPIYSFFFNVCIAFIISFVFYVKINRFLKTHA